MGPRNNGAMGFSWHYISVHVRDSTHVDGNLKICRDEDPSTAIMNEGFLVTLAGATLNSDNTTLICLPPAVHRIKKWSILRGWRVLCKRFEVFSHCFSLLQLNLSISTDILSTIHDQTHPATAVCFSHGYRKLMHAHEKTLFKWRFVDRSSPAATRREIPSCGHPRSTLAVLASSSLLELRIH